MQKLFAFLYLLQNELQFFIMKNPLWNEIFIRKFYFLWMTKWKLKYKIELTYYSDYLQVCYQI